MKNNWPVKKLGEIAEYINGYPFKPSDWQIQGLPIIRIQNLNDKSKPFNYFGGQINERFKIRNNDILISWSASLGVFRWNQGDAWLNQHIFKALPDRSMISEGYFLFLIDTKMDEMKSKVHGGTMQHITKGNFENIQVEIPPLEIQQKIVGRLDAIRKAQELNDLQISKTQELFESLGNEAFLTGQY